jgi:hypothetical protein
MEVRGPSQRSSSINPVPCCEERSCPTRASKAGLLDPNTGHVSEIPIADAKAVFFVKSFVEQPKHEDLHFYDAQAEASFLWVRITFFDGHVIECLVPNTSEMVLSAGFFAWSIDPEANNLAVYIVKKMIKKFQVLGVRHLTPKNVNGSPTESWGRSDSIHLQQHAYPSD